MVDEAIVHEDRSYILAGPATDARTLVLKYGDTFGVFNAFGDIDNRSHVTLGLFTEGMRHLSQLRTRIDGQRPLLLSSKVTDDNTRIIIDLTNPDVAEHGKLAQPRGTLHLLRTLYLWGDACFERLTLSNYAQQPLEVVVSLEFESDFADIFEVRGMDRARYGDVLEPQVFDDHVILGYHGLDGVTRRTRIDCTPIPDSLTASEVQFRAALEPRGRTSFYLTVRCEPTCTMKSTSYKDNAIRLDHAVEASQHQNCRIDSSSKPFTQWINRSYADIRMLLTQTREGPYPYAGVPWFSTPFGRDGIITALQLLSFNPDIARGVLQYLASTQAQEHDASRDAEPGKILHERRTDEMAAIGEVPFGQYYGSVDATPLFVILAGAYYARSGDLGFIQTIWPNIERALEWIDHHGDVDGDGFVEYQAKSSDGLGNQGWKDSHDAIFHADGTLAASPIALCEVQGYVYQAKQHAAALARALARNEQADALLKQSETLQRRFNQAFWVEKLETYALALDGNKQPCAVRASNAGHCLFSGIADPERAERVCRMLMDRTMYSGWGVQTIASTEARFNPMSYHNGSIWPHDNAMIASGLARYGFQKEALRIFNSWFDASVFLDLHRLPELFCGFRRRVGKGPTLYPVACSPQAWAAGSVFMMLEACLGLSIDGPRREVHVHRPRMPRGINEFHIRNLRLDHASIDLLFHKEKRDVGVLVMRKEGPLDIIVSK